MIRERLRLPLRVAGFGLTTAGLLALYAARDLMVSEDERSALRDRWTGRWTRSLLSIFGIRVDVIGARVPARGSGAHLVVSNHRSTIDVGLLLETFGGLMVSRADLAKWPLVGAAARKAGTVFVERSDRASGARVIREMAARLQRGDNVLIFPEGTTFSDDTVRPFLRGGFIAAARAGVPVLPVGIAYQTGSGAAFVNESFTQHLGRMASAPPTRVTLCVGDPIGPSRDAAGLCAAAQASVADLVLRARAHVDMKPGWER
jgi:1-acyl-sn-glycerol-3-phosphate acyltransferase